MAGEQQTIDLMIRALLSAEGFEQVKQKIGELEQRRAEAAANSKNASKDEASGFHQISEELVGMAAQFVAVEKAWEFVKGSFDAAVGAEKQFSQLGSVMKVLAGASNEDVAATKDWVEAQGLAYGVTNEQMVPAFRQLIAITGDVKASQLAMNIALDANKAGLADVGEATNVMTQWLTRGTVVGRGPFAQMLREIQTESKKAHGGHEDHAEMLKVLVQRMHDAAAATDNTATHLDQQKVRWERTKEAIGGFLLKLVDDFQPVMATAAHGLAMVEEGLLDIGAVVTSAAEQFGLFSQALDEMAHGHFIDAFHTMQAAGDSFANTLDEMAAKNHKVVEDVDKAWSEQAKAVPMSAKEQEAAIAALSGQIGKAGKTHDDHNKKVVEGWKLRELAINAAVDNEMERLGKLAELYEAQANDPKLNPMQQAEALAHAAELRREITKKQEEDDKRATQEAKTAADEQERIALDLIKKTAKDQDEEDRMLLTHYKIRAQLAAAGSKERADAEARVGELLKKQGAKETAEAQTEEKKREAIVKGFEQFTVKSEKTTLQEKLKDAQIALKDEKLTSAQRIAILKAEAAIKKQLRASELQGMTSMLSEGLNLAEGAFGKSKGMAVAQATMHMFQSAVSAYQAGVQAAAQTGFGAMAAPAVGAAFAALALAAGAANIASIKKADYSGGSAGFDDPENDLIMKTAGRKWAQDMNKHLASGWMEDLQHQRNQMGGGGGSTVQQSFHNTGATYQSTHLTVQGLPLINTASEPMMKDLYVQLQEMGKHSRQGTIQ